jgi:hypothetical protein
LEILSRRRRLRRLCHSPADSDADATAEGDRDEGTEGVLLFLLQLHGAYFNPPYFVVQLNGFLPLLFVLGISFFFDPSEWDDFTCPNQ